MTEIDRGDDPNPVAGSSAHVTDSAKFAESISIIPDGGVVKEILKEGSGDVPPLHARCLGAYPDHTCLP